MDTLYRSSCFHGADAKTAHDQPGTRPAECEDTPTISSGFQGPPGDRHEAPPTIDLGDRLVTPAKATTNSAGEPVPLHHALAIWTDGSMASHTQMVRGKAERFAEVRSTCTDHSPDRKTCPNCKKAKLDLDSAKRRGIGHCYTGHFVFRHRFGLVALNQMVPLDFDGMDVPEEDRDRIASLPYFVGSRVSGSGRGLHALFYVDSLPEWDGLWPPAQFVTASRVMGSEARRAAYQSAGEANPQWLQRIDELSEAYNRAWRRLVEQVRVDLGLRATADESAKDVGRLLYDSHDDDAKFNLRPESLPGPPEAEAAPLSDLVNAALHALNSIQPPIDTSNWTKLVFNCKATRSAGAGRGGVVKKGRPVRA